MSGKIPCKDLSTQEQWAWFEEHLTHEVRKRLFNEAYRVLQNKADAEDALQEGLRIALVNLPSLRSEDRFYSWLFKIVRHEALHLLKREAKSRKTTRHFMNVKAHLEAVAGPDKLLISKEEHERLRQEIDRLKSPEKEILLLKLRTNKSFKEIAAELGLNYHTTRSKFTRACNLIKKRMDKEGGDGSHEKK